MEITGIILELKIMALYTNWNIWLEWQTWREIPTIKNEQKLEKEEMKKNKT